MNFTAIPQVERSVGRHLLIDGFTASAEPLASAPALESLFQDLVRSLGMEILVPPVTKEVPLDADKLASASDEGGITSFCVITTSHLSIHTWPLRRFFSMDVYSCKDFDAEAAIAFIRERLGCVSVNVVDVVRTAPAAPEMAALAEAAR